MKGSVVVKNEPNKLLFSELPRDFRGRFHTGMEGSKVGSRWSGMRGGSTQKPVSAVQTVYQGLSTRVQSEAKRIANAYSFFAIAVKRGPKNIRFE